MKLFKRNRPGSKTEYVRITVKTSGCYVPKWFKASEAPSNLPIEATEYR